MPIPFLALVLAALPQSAPPHAAQLPAPIATVQTTAETQAAPRTPLPSAALQPAVDSLRSLLIILRIEKWKAPNAIRDTANSNLDSIQRDLDTTLPPLLKVADASPTSVTSLLPVFRNINALYDVLLRVSGAADVAAPKPQADSLHQAISTLDQSRRNLGDMLQNNASTQDQQIVSLQTQLTAAKAAAVPPPPPPAPTPTPKTKPKAKKKPASS
jgi:hypothetical protein